MGTDGIIKWSNRIAIFAITLLIYWVFIFISVIVFDFKIFRENISEAFAMSIMGILSLLAGAMVISIMYNLTKISVAVSKTDAVQPKKKFAKLVVLFIVSFPVIFGFLFLGDFRSSMKKEKMIKVSALSLVEENQPILKRFTEYRFDYTWISKTSSDLALLKKIDENFPSVDLLVQDEIEGKTVFLRFTSYFNSQDDDREKTDFIYSCSAEERAYLSSAFKGKAESRFGSADGHYELYYPVKVGSKIIVLYLSEYQRYGKMGS